MECCAVRSSVWPVGRFPRSTVANEWALVSLRQALLEAELVDAINPSTIGRILSDADFRPHRYRMWVHSPDPLFKEKVREVVDLYLSSARSDTAVLCIDEKTGMQALRRRFAGRLPSPGEEGRWEFEYRRQGTRCLTAAFNVHSGQVIGRCTPRRTKADPIAFMDEVVVPAYPTQLVHVAWDNLNTHHGPHWDEFNRRHGERFRFHDTPIHASWCNQVELWFSILARRVLRRASFRDVEDLMARVMAFIDLWNKVEGKPFRWTFTGYPVQSGLERRDSS
jgi:transposase